MLGKVPRTGRGGAGAGQGGTGADALEWVKQGLDKPGGSNCKSQKQARHPQEVQEDETTLAPRMSNNVLHLPAAAL